MTTVEIYKGIEIKKGFRGAYTFSTGTHKNAGKRNKILLDSIVYEIEGKEYSFSISRGGTYEDYKKITRQEIDFQLRRLLPTL